MQRKVSLGISKISPKAGLTLSITKTQGESWKVHNIFWVIHIMGKIFISAGHYLHDSGTTSILGTTEAEEMIKTRDLIILELQARGLEFESVPDNLDLAPTIRYINNQATTGDVALEIHGNSAQPSARGTEAFYIAGNNQREEDAELLIDSLLHKVPNLINRGAKPDNQSQHSRLAFCRDVNIPSVLLELCFLSNRNDMDLLFNQRSEFAKGIVDGLQAWSRQTGRIISSSSLPSINIKVNGQLQVEEGILVNSNSFVPVDLVERLGVNLSTLNLRRVTQGRVVYIKAVDLEQFDISVGFENATKTVVLNTIARNQLGRIDQVMGRGNASATELVTFLSARNPSAPTEFPNLAQIYIEQATSEGVNHDIAFCQMCLETGFLMFGGDVEPDQNNFCGLGTTGGGVKGAKFADIKTGVKAHIQHLKAYASTEPVAQPPIVDPRFNLIQRGIAPLVNDLSGRWAADLQYGTKILSLVKQLYRASGLL